jgi:hypothetical protein
VIQNLAVDLIERASHESGDFGLSPPAQPRVLLHLVFVKPLQPLQLLGTETEVTEDFQVLGTLRALIDMDRDRRRDSNLHGGHQQARKKRSDSGTGDLLIQAAEMQTQSVDDIALHLRSTTICLAAGPGDGFLQTKNSFPANPTPPDMVDHGFRHARNTPHHYVIIPLHRLGMQYILS